MWLLINIFFVVKGLEVELRVLSFIIWWLLIIGGIVIIFKLYGVCVEFLGNIFI